MLMATTTDIREIEFDEKIQYILYVLFQNSLDYETFVQLVEIHNEQPTWKMYFEKMKKKLCNLSWLKKDNVMSNNETM